MFFIFLLVFIKATLNYVNVKCFIDWLRNKKLLSIIYFVSYRISICSPLPITYFLNIIITRRTNTHCCSKQQDYIQQNTNNQHEIKNYFHNTFLLTSIHYWTRDKKYCPNYSKYHFRNKWWVHDCSACSDCVETKEVCVPLLELF